MGIIILFSVWSIVVSSFFVGYSLCLSFSRKCEEVMFIRREHSRVFSFGVEDFRFKQHWSYKGLWRDVSFSNEEPFNVFAMTWHGIAWSDLIFSFVFLLFLLWVYLGLYAPGLIPPPWRIIDWVDWGPLDLIFVLGTVSFTRYYEVFDVSSIPVAEIVDIVFSFF